MSILSKRVTLDAETFKIAENLAIKNNCEIYEVIKLILSIYQKDYNSEQEINTDIHLRDIFDELLGIICYGNQNDFINTLKQRINDENLKEAMISFLQGCIAAIRTIQLEE